MFLLNLALLLGLCVFGREQSGNEVWLFAICGVALNQAILVAIWTGLGPEPAIVRIPSGILLVSTQAALMAIPFLKPLVEVASLEFGPPKSEMLTASGAVAFSFLMAILLFSLVRAINWRLTRGTTRRPRYSAGATLLVLIATIAALIGLFRDRIAWEVIGATWLAEIQTQDILIVLWAGACVGFLHWLLVVFFLWLALSRFTAQRLYARSWRWLLAILAVVAIGCHAVHQLDAIEKAPEIALSTFDILTLCVGVFFLAYGPTLLSLLILGAAGWRLAPPLDSDEPAESPSHSYPLGIHVAALAAAAAAATALIWTETLDTAYVHMTATSISSDERDRFTELHFSEVSDVTIARIPKSTPLRSLSFDSGRVSADAFARVRNWTDMTRLELDNVQLEPAALRAIADLHSLSDLSLGDAFGDAHLKELPPLATLESLVLFESQTTGAGLSELPKHPILKLVHLGNTGVDDTDLRQMPAMPQLETLVLFGTKITDAGLPELAKLPSLKYLHLSNTRITDKGLETVARLPNLEQLLISETRVTDEGLARLKGLGLKHLSVSGMNDARFEHYLAALEPQESLELTFWWNVGDAGLAHIGEQTVTLKLSSPNFTDGAMPHIAKLKKLRWLELSSSQVTSQGLAHLAALQQLRHLDLSHTAIDAEGLAHISKLKKLQTLHLSGTKITGEGLAHISKLAKLQSLHLIGTKLASEGLRHIEKLTELQYLNLWSTSIDDDGMVHLAKLRQLRHLDLSDTSIGDDGLRHLAGLKQLRRLKLFGSKATGQGVAHLRDPKTEIEIWIEWDKVSHDQRAELKRLPNLIISYY
jgi:Leucine-rich repeat (LRR) protein